MEVMKVKLKAMKSEQKKEDLMITMKVKQKAMQLEQKKEDLKELKKDKMLENLWVMM